MVRSVVAGVAGLLCGGVTVAVVEGIGHAVYPPPPGLRLDDPEALRAHVAALPVGALLWVLAAWCAGALVGGAVASGIGRARPYLLAGVVGGLLLAATVVNLVLIPHPAWLEVGAGAGIPAAALLGGGLAARARGPAAAPAAPAAPEG